jgi:release factor glutamine methyltransferase
MGSDFKTINDIRTYLISELKAIYPEKEISAITNHLLKTQFGLNRLQLMTNSSTVVTKEMTNSIIQLTNDLKTGKPVQYIIGETPFYDCTIKVSKDTLIPRPETEELVDLIVNENKGFCGKIVDFGTGSGCIAVALSKIFPASGVTGIDISKAALEIARSNAALNKVNAIFFEGDVLNPDFQSLAGTDMIVSNPPYVLESEKVHMHINILGFEPHQALFVPDNDPLKFYRAISGIAKSILIKKGRIYFEINERKGAEILNLLQSDGFTEIKLIKDMNGKDRFIKGIYNG